jgi:hypothetical protein
LNTCKGRILVHIGIYGGSTEFFFLFVISNGLDLHGFKLPSPSLP